MLIRPLGGQTFTNTIANQAIFENADLTGQFFFTSDFSFANFRGANLFMITVENSSFSNADFSGADLTEAEFFDFGPPQVDLSFANLSGANLTLAELDGVIAVNANLSFADLTNARLRNSDFTGSNITGTIWNNTECPDGTNSDGNGGTCAGHLTP